MLQTKHNVNDEKKELYIYIKKKKKQTDEVKNKKKATEQSFFTKEKNIIWEWNQPAKTTGCVNVGKGSFCANTKKRKKNHHHTTFWYWQQCLIRTMPWQERKEKKLSSLSKQSRNEHEKL